MKVLFYTFGMVAGTEHLMPWRTLVEVARHMNSTGQFQAAICSAQSPGPPRDYNGVPIINIEPSKSSLRTEVKNGGWEVLYYPVTYRQGLKSQAELATIPAMVIAYIPGGLCPLSGSLQLGLTGHVGIAKPYLMDTIIPHGILARKLHEAGVDRIICQSPLTAKDAVLHGWKKENVFCALPGIDRLQEIKKDDSLLNELGLEGKRFLLFSGAPAPTRGAVIALKAYDKYASLIPDVKLVMLMRRDVSSDFSEFEKATRTIEHKDSVIISYDRLTRHQLFAFFENAWAVLLPFLIVPSEIPLTFFEVMSFGTPIITFHNGGTTDYLKEGLMIAKRRSRKALGNAIVGICSDKRLREQLAQSARDLMVKHPSWEQTAMVWESAISLNA